MKKLVIGFNGEFSGKETLREAIVDLGHEVHLVDELPSPVSLDVCCCLLQSALAGWHCPATSHPNGSNTAAVL